MNLHDERLAYLESAVDELRDAITELRELWADMVGGSGPPYGRRPPFGPPPRSRKEMGRGQEGIGRGGRDC
jgi:hypothetical protein